jgi:uncharacterized repeat protein (TIGR03803 family)
MNGDGALPNGGVIISGNNLYGTTMFGGSGGSGTVFEVNTNGSGFRPLHSFTAMEPTTGANGDGAFPVAALILSGETLYGTAKYGGEWGNGTVFAINTNGTDFSNLYSFAAIDRTTGTNTSGAFLFSTLALYDNTLFGTADSGGGAGNGTIFSIILPPQLNVVASDAGLALNWPTNASGFTLQSTTNLHSPVWTTVPTEPVVVERQNVVTNFIDGTPRFYRLKR